MALGKPSRVDRIDLGGGAGEVHGGPGLSPEERLARLAARFEKRLDGLMESDKLSDEQRQALAEVKAEFSGLVDRLSKALDSIQPDTAARAFQTIRQDMVQAARHVVREDGPAAAQLAGNAAATGSGSVGSGAISDQAPIEGGGSGEGEGMSLSDRLDAAQERVDQRFEKFLTEGHMSPEQAIALQAAHDQFSAVLDRLRNAFEGSDRGADFLRFGFDYAIDEMGREVSSILGDEFYGRPDGTGSGGHVGLYDSEGGQDQGGLPATYSSLA